MGAGSGGHEESLLSELKQLNETLMITFRELQEIRRYVNRIYGEMRDPAIHDFRQKVLEFIERADLIALRETEEKPE